MNIAIKHRMHFERTNELGARGGAVDTPYASETVAELQVSALLRDSVLRAQLHDLKGRMYSVLCTTNALRRGRLDAPDASGRLRVAVREIGAALAHVGAVLDDLPSIDSVRFGALSSEVRSYPLGEVVAQALTLTRPLCSARCAQVSVELGEGAETLECDRTRLLEVLTLMLSNGIRRTPPNGRVRLVATRAGSAVHLAVHDRGAALQDHEVSRLGAAALLDDPARSPLQFSAARRGVELLGGTLRNSPDENGGMVFDAVFDAPSDGEPARPS